MGISAAGARAEEAGVKVRVRAFARAGQVLGEDAQTLETRDDATIEAVWQALAKRCPALEPLRGSMRFARNGTIVEPDIGLQNDDEVALLPPSSGG
jgi:molybdopterin converting factor small subunit